MTFDQTRKAVRGAHKSNPAESAYANQRRPTGRLERNRLVGSSSRP